VKTLTQNPRVFFLLLFIEVLTGEFNELQVRSSVKISFFWVGAAARNSCKQPLIVLIFKFPD